MSWKTCVHEIEIKSKGYFITRIYEVTFVSVLIISVNLGERGFHHLFVTDKITVSNHNDCANQLFMTKARLGQVTLLSPTYRFPGLGLPGLVHLVAYKSKPINLILNHLVLSMRGSTFCNKCKNSLDIHKKYRNAFHTKLTRS